MANKKAKTESKPKASKPKKDKREAFKHLPDVVIDTNVAKGLFCKLVNTRNNSDLTHPMTKDEFKEITDLIKEGDTQALLDHSKTLRPGYINKNLNK